MASDDPEPTMAASGCKGGIDACRSSCLSSRLCRGESLAPVRPGGSNTSISSLRDGDGGQTGLTELLSMVAGEFCSDEANADGGRMCVSTCMWLFHAEARKEDECLYGMVKANCAYDFVLKMK